MRDSNRRIGPSRLSLVALGIALGYLARLTFGGPTVDVEPQNSFSDPIETIDPDEPIDLPLINRSAPEENSSDSSGVVPPISIPSVPFAPIPANSAADFGTEFAHGENAVFEPHGDEVCASGCALSRHPTEELTKLHYQRLIADFAKKPLNETNPALEELLYYGLQTKSLFQSTRADHLDQQQARFLWAQLQYTHAEISLRVVDQEGVVRTWLAPTRVPLDRRHVFEMETDNLQPLVTSGTVKRVGLNHLWVRL